MTNINTLPTPQKNARWIAIRKNGIVTAYIECWCAHGVWVSIPGASRFANADGTLSE